MRTIHPDHARVWLGGALEAASVDGGPTPEQLRLLQGLARGYYGIEGPLDPEPLDPEELAARVVDPGSRRRLVQTLIVLEFARHPPSEEVAASTARYAAALGVDAPMLAVVRHAVSGDRDLLVADYARFGAPLPPEPRLVGKTDEAVAARLAALGHCPGGSLGRAFCDFYDTWGLQLPTAAEEADIPLVAHDFSHVISGYLPNDAVEELALSALLVSSTNGEDHFSALLAGLILYEAGLGREGGLTPVTGALERPGAPDVFADAMRRGAACTHDILDFDHLGVADWPLEEVRATLGVPPRGVRPLT